MSTAKHTPRPWIINHWSNSGNSGVICLKNESGIQYYSGDAVTREYFGIRANIHHSEHTIEASFEGAHIADLNDRGDQSKANAYLIAAAPDLLEALEKIMAARSKDNSVSTFQLTKLLEEIRSIAEQAIRKAKGL